MLHGRVLFAPRLSLKERLARWLLMMRDRNDEDALPITQNLLAEMLGAQSPSITNAARELERSGLIECGRVARRFSPGCFWIKGH